tara:strand:- start:46 stop:213 length:168 start_codon:yes stop_codon:yes gene_type:complete
MITKLDIIRKIDLLKNKLEEIHNDVEYSFTDSQSWSEEQSNLRGQISSLEWALNL